MDAGANVGTIHVLCNSEGSFGASHNSLFSFSANSEDNQNGTVMAHEIAHSIGGLGDEYERYTNKPNTSDTTNPETIKWAKMLGFRGIGVTQAGTEKAFAPSRECMMRWLGQPFCEVCKMELARNLNNPDYVSRPAAIYVADPEISIPHSKTGTLDRDSEKYRISEKNITKANNRDLEFRTVVQNMVNREQHLKMTFRIIGADGTTVKYSEEKNYTIPALANRYDPETQKNHFLSRFRMFPDWLVAIKWRENCGCGYGRSFGYGQNGGAGLEHGQSALQIEKGRWHDRRHSGSGNNYGLRAGKFYIYIKKSTAGRLFLYRK